MASRCHIVIACLAAAVLGASAYHGCGGNGTACERDPQILPVPADMTEDFQFELRNVYTDRQRGARVNIMVRYRYYTPYTVGYYSTESGTFDYRDMQSIVLAYVPAGGKNISADTFWEVINRNMCKELWQSFPIRGLSVRWEVQGMSSGGIVMHRASTVTLGDIEPWPAHPNNFPGCDGMSTGTGNKACTVFTWTDQQAANATLLKQLEATALSKTAKHDKPTRCDTCA